MNSQIGTPFHVASPAWLNGGTYASYEGCPDEIAGIPITAAFMFVVAEKRLALVHNARGWDLPGGHVDEGESGLQAARRETLEETGLNLDGEMILLVGTSVIEQPPHPDYPSVAAHEFHGVKLSELRALRPSLECDSARWFTFEEVRVLCSGRSWFPQWVTN